MKNYCVLIFMFGFLSLFGQNEGSYYTEDGFVAGGYDVVSYFDNKACKGKDAYTYTFDNVRYKFKNQKNLALFKANPEKYMPEYGGWCAYAVAYGEKVKINPKTYEIRDGKLYLFYNFYLNNTLKSWHKEGAETLRDKADYQWQNAALKN